MHSLPAATVPARKRAGASTRLPPAAKGQHAKELHAWGTVFAGHVSLVD